MYEFLIYIGANIVLAGAFYIWARRKILKYEKQISDASQATMKLKHQLNSAKGRQNALQRRYDKWRKKAYQANGLYVGTEQRQQDEQVPAIPPGPARREQWAKMKL